MSVRISVESLSGCAWNGCPSQRGIRILSTELNGRGYNRDWIERQLAHGDADEIRDTYQASRGGASTAHDYCMELLLTTCHLGGQRHWFACPDCCRRAAILYLLPATERFTCRLCAGLNYASQQQSREDTLIDRAHKLRARLGCTGGLFRPSLSELKKPRYMRWPKFWETLHQLNYLEQQVVAEMCASLNLPPP